MVIEYVYSDVEWAKREKLLGQAGDSLEQRIKASEHGGMATTKKTPSRTLGMTVDISPRGFPSTVQWELLYSYVLTETAAVAGDINSKPENTLGDRKMLVRVSLSNPVSTYRQSGLMRDFWTHQVRQETRLNPVSVSFYFPYTPPRTRAHG